MLKVIPKLVVWPQRVLYTGLYSGPFTFKHIKDTLVISLGNPISLLNNAGEDLVQTHCALLTNKFDGTLQVNDSEVLFASLDIMSYSRDLLLRNYGFTLCSNNVAAYYLAAIDEAMLTDVKKVMGLSSEPKPLQQQLNQLINPQSLEPNRRNIDPRVKQSLRIAKDKREEKLLISDIAAALDLSDSRLRHLFKQEMGFSMGEMLSTLRVLTFLENYCRYNSMTYAAADAGYSDLSHLNKSLQKIMGLSFSKILRHNDKVYTAYGE